MKLQRYDNFNIFHSSNVFFRISAITFLSSPNFSSHKSVLFGFYDDRFFFENHKQLPEILKELKKEKEKGG